MAPRRTTVWQPPLYEPKNPAQKVAHKLFDEAQIMFLIGPAGTGKTAGAFGMALSDVLSKPHDTLTLARPMVTCDEETGFLPGDLSEKLGPWMGPFRDVYGSLATDKWDALCRRMAERLELVPIGMLRSRTIRNGILICDEVQNCTYKQLKSIVTRCGENGRVILCGDPEQSDRFDPSDSPLYELRDKLSDLDTVVTVEFDGKHDQMRSPLVTALLERLS